MANQFDKAKAVLLKKLCRNLLSDEEEHLEKIFSKALSTLNNYEDVEFHTSFSPWEEHKISDDVEKILLKKYMNSTETIERFHALNRSLRNMTVNSGSSDNYAEMLLFLLRIAEKTETVKCEILPMDENEINGNISISNVSGDDSTINTNVNSQQWSISSFARGDADILKQKIPNTDSLASPISKKDVPVNHLFTNTPILESDPTASSSRKGSTQRSNKTSKHLKYMPGSDIKDKETVRPSALPLSRHVDPRRADLLSEFEVSENEMIKELLYCMQGIEGKYIRYKSIEEGFHLSPSARVNQHHMILHLMELGYLHNRIKHYINSLFIGAGTVAEGLLNAVRRELTEYYQALATVDSQLNPSPEIADTPLSDEECAKYRLPSLSQLFVWSRDPLLKLQTLCNVLGNVHNKRGGQIVSYLASISVHGNPKTKQIILRLLSSAVQPFYEQIFNWVVNGEIVDFHKEFFVKVNDSADNTEHRDTWDKQFVLRPSMIPAYMMVEVANQILETGRCVNFLHNVCHQRPRLTSAQTALLNLEENKWGDAFSLIQPTNEVSTLINDAYKEVSMNVLRSLNENFKMMRHLEALRKYMLLGQGDFIHYLLEIVEPDLNKSVGALHTYTLMRSLEDAMFKSNAQFDDSDVLSKLGVKMLITTERENASEAFCLQYRLEGPLNMIFKTSWVAYNRMFTYMWRVKRASYMVSKMWRGLKLLSKEVYRLAPEARPVFMKANCLVMEMVNFINHFQYYIASEVVEVSWRKFQTEMKTMESLEKVIQAHNLFLEIIQASCMLNTKPDSVQATMAWHIRTLLDYVQELVPIVETFQSLCELEVDRRKTRQEKVARIGVSRSDDEENRAVNVRFSEEMSKVKAKFKILSNQYQEKLKSLLMLFSGNHEEHDLILLSHRIDFNEYYKQNDPRLSDSMKLHKIYRLQE